MCTSRFTTGHIKILKEETIKEYYDELNLCSNSEAYHQVAKWHQNKTIKNQIIKHQVCDFISTGTCIEYCK